MGVFSHAAATVHESPRLIHSKTGGAPPVTFSEIPAASVQGLEARKAEGIPPGPPHVPTAPRTVSEIPALVQAGLEARRTEGLPPGPLHFVPTARRTEALPAPDNRLPLSSRAPRDLPGPDTAFLPTARPSDPLPPIATPEALRRPERLPEPPPGEFVPSRAPALPSAPESDWALLKARRAEEPSGAPGFVWTLAAALAVAPPPALAEPFAELLRSRRAFVPVDAPDWRFPVVPATVPPGAVVQLNIVDVGFREVRMLSSTDPDVIDVGFGGVRLAGFREVLPLFFREVRDLQSDAE